MLGNRISLFSVFRGLSSHKISHNQLQTRIQIRIDPFYLSHPCSNKNFFCSKKAKFDFLDMKAKSQPI